LIAHCDCFLVAIIAALLVMLVIVALVRSFPVKKDSPLLKKLLTSTLLILITFGASAHAADRLFDITLNVQRVDSPGALVGQVSFNETSGDALKIGDVFDIALPSGKIVTGEVVLNTSSAPIQGHGEEFVSASKNSKLLRLDDNAGSLELHLVDGAIAGITFNNLNSGEIFRAALSENGVGALTKVDPHSILCAELHKPIEELSKSALVVNAPAGLTEEIVRNLQSRPGATNTIYMDNWGGEYLDEDGRWNGGEAFTYTPFDDNGDPTTFSPVELRYMWIGWAEMAEDYADFDINITTSRSVYDATPFNNRARLISTTTCFFYLNCGALGAAHLNGFTQQGLTEGYRTGWVWGTTPAYFGLAHSHETGHLMGLGHHGVNVTTSDSYYTGHGNWAPIMGAADPIRRYVQWSNGEYPSADNQQDDLAILSKVLDVRPDDAGDSKASANTLEPTSGANYMITQDGISPDVDVFAFTLGVAQDVFISAMSTLGANGESRYANAAFNVSLENSAGTVVSSITSSDYSPLQPDTNIFSFTGNLDADTYYITVDAVSPDTDWSTGFGEYGNGGEYRLVADFDPSLPPVSNPAMLTPSENATLAGYAETFTWESNGTSVAQYWLYLGSEAGKADYVNSGAILSTTLSYKTTKLPVNGEPVFARLWWLEEGKKWQSVDYTYTAANSGGPAFTSPASGSTLAGVSNTFQWTDNGVGATEYWLYIGSEVGGFDLYNSGSISDTTQAIDYLPANASAIYTRLWFRESAADIWRFVDDTFSAASAGGPTITIPAPGSAISGSTVTLNWQAGGANVSEWWLYVGTGTDTSEASRNIYNSRSLGAALTDTVPMPADGSTVSVTLWYKIDNKWKSTVYTYQSNTDT